MDELKVRQHGAGRGRVWRKFRLAADIATHEIICADLSLSDTKDAQARPGLINQIRLKIRSTSADGAYDACYCNDVLLRKKLWPLTPTEKWRTIMG